jgi:hypothetical protein
MNKNSSVIILILYLLSSCQSNLDNIIKTGNFDQCPTATVEDLIKNYMSTPKWDSFMGEDNTYYLNVKGGIMYDGEPAKAHIQFRFLDNMKWYINALEVDGNPQNEYFITSLVSDMCLEHSQKNKGATRYREPSTQDKTKSDRSTTRVSTSEVKKRLNEYIRLNSLMHAELGIELYLENAELGTYWYSGAVCFGPNSYDCQYVSASFTTWDYGLNWEVEFQ